MVSCSTLDPLTVIVPAVPVPSKIQPSVVVGVTDCEAEFVAVINPFEDTEIVGYAVILVLGVAAVPPSSGKSMSL